MRNGKIIVDSMFYVWYNDCILRKGDDRYERKRSRNSNREVLPYA